ncbi:DUF5082 family protein [Bacillus sp. FJAT-47783]|uniref:YwqH-like family protein n=1 Tax=Bacillus sp. FJAT-47783 TaxID=2922712 RepID=UPI001FAB9441|nr:DUF5082 family protein [Bacillus sp. FJAT-47783]
MAEVDLAIAALKQDIAGLSARVQENKIKLQRLRKAKKNIENEQEELINHRKNIFEPELSSTSWAGKHASEHLNIRDSIALSSNNIINQQIEEILGMIEQKINELEKENTYLMDSISVKEREITRLKNQ